MDLEFFELAGNGWTLRILFLNKIPSVFFLIITPRWSHVAACIVVGWLQLIFKLNFLSNNNIIILMGESVIAHSFSYN